MKQIILAFLIAIGLSTAPAFAWDGHFKFVNHTIHWPPDLDVTSIIFTTYDGPHTIPLPDVGPGQSATFSFLKYTGQTWATFTNEYKAPITAPNKIDLSVQNTITVTQTSSGGYVFTYSSDPSLH